VHAFQTELGSPGLDNAAASTILFFFVSLPESELVSVRLNCAWNFPAMLHWRTAAAFSGQLGDIFQRLLNDSDPAVRACLAGSMHEVARMLGGGAGGTALKRLRPHMLLLLNDPAPQVHAAVNTTFVACVAIFFGFNRAGAARSNPSSLTNTPPTSPSSKGGSFMFTDAHDGHSGAARAIGRGQRLGCV